MLMLQKDPMCKNELSFAPWPSGVIGNATDVVPSEGRRHFSAASANVRDKEGLTGALIGKWLPAQDSSSLQLCLTSGFLILYDARWNG